MNTIIVISQMMKFDCYKGLDQLYMKSLKLSFQLDLGLKFKIFMGAKF